MLGICQRKRRSPSSNAIASNRLRPPATYGLLRGLEMRITEVSTFPCRFITPPFPCSTTGTNPSSNAYREWNNSCQCSQAPVESQADFSPFNQCDSRIHTSVSYQARTNLAGSLCVFSQRDSVGDGNFLFSISLPAVPAPSHRQKSGSSADKFSPNLRRVVGERRSSSRTETHRPMPPSARR